VIFGLHGCPEDSGKGQFNLGGYCNPEVDALADKILSETDQKVRDDLISDAWAKTIAEVSYLPLHQQALAWGVRSNVSLKQRADNQFHWRHVVVE
jgi:peptide/nickel transport system substrate-binding protein